MKDSSKGAAPKQRKRRTTKRPKRNNGAQRQQRRRYPFSDETRLIELVDTRHLGDIKRLVADLREFLLAGEGTFVNLNRLYFDLTMVEGRRSYVFARLGIFLKKMREEHGLKCPQSVFFRYLAQPEHCNLGVSENTLKARILEAIP